MESSSKTIYDCIIIGAGISGLSFAHHLSKENQNILILEKESRHGGQIKTFRSDKSDYWCELGAHTCYNMYAHLLSIVKDLYADDEVLPMSKCSYMMYASGKIRNVVSQLSFFSMATHCFRIFNSKKEGKTVKKFFLPIVGKKNYNPLFSNLFRAVISQNADEYPAELFLKKRKKRMEEFPRKYSFRKGMETLPDLIVEKDKLTVKYNNEVLSISFNGSAYTISANDNTYHSKNIAFASDPQTTSRLTKDIDYNISTALSGIELSQSESLNIVVKKGDVALQNVAGIIPMNDDFSSVVARDTVLHPLYRGFTFHFEEGKKTLNEQIDIACKVLNISTSDIVEHSTTKHVLPSLRMKDMNIAEKLNTSPTIYILGNYFYGLSLEDCAHRSAEEYKRYKANMA